MISQELNSYLSSRTFFVGHKFSLADLLLYYGMHSKIVSIHKGEKIKIEEYPLDSTRTDNTMILFII